MEPDRGRAGAAVEGEGDRPLAAVLDAVAGVGDEEDGGPGLAVLLLEQEGAGGGGVGDLLAADDGLVLGGDDLLFGLGRLELFGLGVFGRVLGGPGPLLGGGGGEDRQDEQDRQYG